MRRVKTVDVLNISVNSENKHRMTKDELKKYKIDRLRLKFKKVVHRIDALKKQTNEDYQQFIISSERLQRMALESQQKTKRIGIDSLQAKRRLTLPSTLETSEISHFTLNDEAHMQNGQRVTKALRISDQEFVQKMPSGAQQRAEDLGFSKVDSKITATNELRNSAGSTKKNEQFIVNDKARENQKYCLIKQSKQLEKQINTGKKLETRRNRFEAQWYIPTKPSEVVIPLRARNNKGQQTIRPYIWAMAFSIILLVALSY